MPPPASNNNNSNLYGEISTPYIRDKTGTPNKYAPIVTTTVNPTIHNRIFNIIALNSCTFPSFQLVASVVNKGFNINPLNRLIVNVGINIMLKYVRYFEAMFPSIEYLTALNIYIDINDPTKNGKHSFSNSNILSNLNFILSFSNAVIIFISNNINPITAIIKVTAEVIIKFLVIIIVKINAT